jgi:hypothetical protein
VEDLVSRGHRFVEVMDGYPVGLVLNLSRAAELNRRQAAYELAVGVSLGIRDAFSKEGFLVKSWLAPSADGTKPVRENLGMKKLLARLPVVRRTRPERKDG